DRVGRIASLDLGQNGDALGAEPVDANQGSITDGLGVVRENMTHDLLLEYLCWEQPMPRPGRRQSGRRAPLRGRDRGDGMISRIPCLRLHPFRARAIVRGRS